MYSCHSRPLVPVARWNRRRGASPAVAAESHLAHDHRFLDQPFARVIVGRDREIVIEDSIAVAMPDPHSQRNRVFVARNSKFAMNYTYQAQTERFRIHHF